MIKAVFFDFDGVIVESVDIKTKAFTELFGAEGPDAVRQVVAYHLDNAGVSRFDKFHYIYREILKRPLTDEEFKRLCDIFSGLVVDGVATAPYVEGAIEFLEEYSSAYECFVVSATPQQEMEEIIRRRGLVSFFTGIYGAPNKKADVVRKVLAANGTNPADAVYIGDAMSDYEAARDNGLHFIARINRNENIFEKTDCIKIPNLSHLAEILDSIA